MTNRKESDGAQKTQNIDDISTNINGISTNIDGISTNIIDILSFLCTSVEYLLARA